MKRQPDLKENAENASEQGPFTLGLQLLNGGKTSASKKSFSVLYVPSIRTTVRTESEIRFSPILKLGVVHYFQFLGRSSEVKHN